MRSTDAQRGDGAFEKSIAALRLLNAAGYGEGDPRRVLTLVSNPAGAFLAADQRELEREWKESLERTHGIAFDRLIALNNMPIARYLEWLETSGNLERYLALLVASFNPAAAAGLMCRNTLSVGWDGRLYDCDFNQMLGLEARPAGGAMRLAGLRPGASRPPRDRDRAPLLRLHRGRGQLLRRRDGRRLIGGPVRSRRRPGCRRAAARGRRAGSRREWRRGRSRRGRG